MPIYDFACGACGERFEELVDVGTETRHRAEAARRRAPTRILSAPGRPVEPREDPGRSAKARARQRGAPLERRRATSRPSASRRAGQGPRRHVSESAEARRERLVEVYREASDCTRCPLSETRTKAVFGAGNADADLMFVGEAPGAEEDRRACPSSAAPGSCSTSCSRGSGYARDVFIANVLKCRPPGNRDPQPEEIEACRPYLERRSS